MKFKPVNLILLILLLVAASFGQVLQKRLNAPDDLAFEQIDGLPGWRQTQFRDVTLPGGNAAGAVFLGIGEGDARDKLTPAALCRVLYPTQGQRVPAAYFADVNCPNCQSLELKLDARLDRLDLNRIELPLLGRSSEIAAKAILATRLHDPEGRVWPKVAAKQSGIRLGTSVRALLEQAGLDPDRIQADMNGPRVAALLETNFSAADTLGIWGTPALTIGSTLIMGDLKIETLDRLIELEATRENSGC